eukprot:352122-Chlamydomonas_euryale.AAC.5
MAAEAVEKAGRADVNVAALLKPPCVRINHLALRAPPRPRHGRGVGADHGRRRGGRSTPGVPPANRRAPRLGC